MQAVERDMSENLERKRKPADEERRVFAPSQISFSDASRRDSSVAPSSSFAGLDATPPPCCARAADHAITATACTSILLTLCTVSDFEPVQTRDDAGMRCSGWLR